MVEEVDQDWTQMESPMIPMVPEMAISIIQMDHAEVLSLGLEMATNIIQMDHVEGLEMHLAQGMVQVLTVELAMMLMDLMVQDVILVLLLVQEKDPIQDMV